MKHAVNLAALILIAAMWGWSLNRGPTALSWFTGVLNRSGPFLGLRHP